MIPHYSSFRNVLILYPALILSGLIFQSPRSPVKLAPIKEARLIALYQLSTLRNLPDFQGLKVSSVTPVWRVGKKDEDIFDVKLVNKDGGSRGFILVNTSHTDSPVLLFTSEGPSLTQILKAKAKSNEARIIYVTPTYYVALDSADSIIASLGDFALDMNVFEKIRTKKLSGAEYLSLVAKEALKSESSSKKSTNEDWKEVDRFLDNFAGGSTSNEVTQTPDVPTTYAYYAEGYERAPRLVQIPPHTGVNRTDNYSGCGPRPLGRTLYAGMTCYGHLKFYGGLRM